MWGKNFFTNLKINLQDVLKKLWIEFESNSRHFGFSTRNLGHVSQNIMWPRLLVVEKPKRRELLSNSIQSELQIIHCQYEYWIQ